MRKKAADYCERFARITFAPGWGSGDADVAFSKADAENVTHLSNWQNGGATNGCTFGPKGAVKTRQQGGQQYHYWFGTITAKGTLHGFASLAGSVAAHTAAPTRRRILLPLADVAGADGLMVLAHNWLASTPTSAGSW